MRRKRKEWEQALDGDASVKKLRTTETGTMEVGANFSLDDPDDWKFDD